MKKKNSEIFHEDFVSGLGKHSAFAVTDRAPEKKSEDGTLNLEAIGVWFGSSKVDQFQRAPDGTYTTEQREKAVVSVQTAKRNYLTDSISKGSVALADYMKDYTTNKMLVDKLRLAQATPQRDSQLLDAENNLDASLSRIQVSWRPEYEQGARIVYPGASSRCGEFKIAPLLKK